MNKKRILCLLASAFICTVMTIILKSMGQYNNTSFLFGVLSYLIYDIIHTIIYSKEVGNKNV